MPDDGSLFLDTLHWLADIAVFCWTVKAPPDRREIFAATAKPSLEFCRGLERTRRQVAVPTLARKNRAGFCDTAAIYSLSLLARFFVAAATIMQVSHYNSESSLQLAIRMSFVGRLRRLGPDRSHSCFVFSHTSESACMG